MSAVKMINVTPSGAKPQASVARVVNIIAVNASGFRPSVSESVPRGRTKAPFVSLRHPKHFHQYTTIENIQLKDGTWKVEGKYGSDIQSGTRNPNNIPLHIEIPADDIRHDSRHPGEDGRLCKGKGYR
jgi:hypothetical protein